MTRHHHALDRRTFVTGRSPPARLRGCGKRPVRLRCRRSRNQVTTRRRQSRASTTLKADAKPAAPATAAANEGEVRPA